MKPRSRQQKDLSKSRYVVFLQILLGKEVMYVPRSPFLGDWQHSLYNNNKRVFVMGLGGIPPHVSPCN